MPTPKLCGSLADGAHVRRGSLDGSYRPSGSGSGTTMFPQLASYAVSAPVETAGDVLRASRPRDEAATKEDVVRNQLLMELAILRERHEALQSRRRHPPGGGGDERLEVEGSEERGLDESCGRFAQSDRDAIEALFGSVDDFTRQFNEGAGNVSRGSLPVPGRGPGEAEAAPSARSSFRSAEGRPRQLPRLQSRDLVKRSAPRRSAKPGSPSNGANGRSSRPSPARGGAAAAQPQRRHPPAKRVAGDGTHPVASARANAGLAPIGVECRPAAITRGGGGGYVALAPDAVRRAPRRAVALRKTKDA